MDASEVSIRGIIKSAVTDSVQSNASFAASSGLRAKITRTAGTNACEECASLAGSWYYGDEPKKVYWRHGGCTCTVTYDPGTGKTQNVHTKAWSDSNEAEIETRKTVGLNNDTGRENLGNLGESKFNSQADPMADVMGSAYSSNPEELSRIKEQLRNGGVAINENSTAIGYGCTSVGTPGTLSINSNASYSAWLHELQHIKDDEQIGWSGVRILYSDPEERIEWEKRAYNQEIDYALALGYDDVAEKLRGNLNAEIERISNAFRR